MKLKLFIFLFFITIELSAQEYTLKAVPIVNNDSELTMQIKIKMYKLKEYNLGNATIRFSYNNNELNFPNIPTKGVDYNFDLNNSGQYSCSVSKPEKDEISVNIYFKEGIPQAISNKYFNIVSINFSKKKRNVDLNLKTCSVEIFSPRKSKKWVLED